MFIKESFQTSGGKNIEYAIDFPGKMEKEKDANCNSKLKQN